MDRSEHNIIQSLTNGERVTSTYAEIYLDDDYCKKDKKDEEKPKRKLVKPKSAHIMKLDDWASPSDTLIGKVDLIPPFTSRVTRGTTHKGILEIGDGVLRKERDRFLKKLAELLADNDSAWMHIQEQEKLIVAQKVKAIYEKIFDRKTALMQKEISMFYEETLRELEKHLRTEVRSVLMSAHCSMIADLNQQITEKLQHEKSILEKALRKRYNAEIKKLNKYYSLLLHNEKRRSNKRINQALYERNQAFNTFCKQIETENLTSTMYVMCTERRKCRMKQFLLQNYNTKEIEEKLRVIKEKQDLLEEFNKGRKHILEINKEWEEKVQKILQLFLKFISFSLKLLPEQTTFLLDLEKLVVLQLNEIHKHPVETPNILINEDDFKNMFEFQKPEKDESVCEGEPFVIEGDLEPSIPTPYGSRETLPSHVDLPYFRLQRQFIYAKCQKFEDVRNYLESLRCKCHDKPSPEPSESDASSTVSEKAPSPEPTPESSNELLMVEDIERLKNCPLRGCRNMMNRMSFPNLDEYLDFDEEKFARVVTILGDQEPLEPPPPLVDPRDIVRRDLLFAETKERFRNAETQCSSKEDVSVYDVQCPCMDDISEKLDEKILNTSQEDNLIKILTDRRNSLKMMMHYNPKLLKLFSEESFDFIY